MVKYLCIIQARLNSSRLPAKVMLDLAGKTLLERVYESVEKSTKINKIVVATSNEPTDDIIEKKLQSLQIEYYRGNLDNVLKRFYDTAIKYNAKNIIRITADNPLMDGLVIDNLIELYELKQSDYSSFSNAIYGLSAEIFNISSLELAYKNAQNNFDKEHVTPYIIDKCQTFISDIEIKYRLPHVSATIDTISDYILMNEFFTYCYNHQYIANIDNFIIYMTKIKKVDTFQYWKKIEFLYETIHKDKFDEWNLLKKNLNTKEKIINFYQGNIYFMSIGKNIGHEVYGKEKLFLRPVLVYKKLTKSTFIGIPLTSQEKVGSYFFQFSYKKGKRSVAMFHQIRVFDIRRSEYLSGKINKNTFENLEYKLNEFMITSSKRRGMPTKG